MVAGVAGVASGMVPGRAPGGRLGRLARWASSAHLRLLVLIVVIELCLSAALLVVAANQLEVALDARDESLAVQLMDDLTDRAEEMSRAEFARSIRMELREPDSQGALIALADPRGRIVAGNIARWPPGLVAGRQVRWVELRPRSAGRPPIRYAILGKSVYGHYRLLAGHTIRRAGALYPAMAQAAFQSLLIGLPLALLGAWLAVRVIEGRVERISATTAAVAQGQLSQRVPIDGSGDSFDRLGSQVNEMLERTGALIEELRTLSDSLAHDLASPIMRLRARIEQAVVAHHGDEEWSETLAPVLVEAGRLQAMVGAALEIARAEAGLAKQQMAVHDLGELVRDIAELYEPLVEEHGRRLELAVCGDCRALVHREMLTIAISNLIDNALKYGAGDIELGVRSAEGEAHVTVADSGPGIAVENEQLALSRFGRLDNARTREGAGLGLALVQSTLRMHGARIAFQRTDERFQVEAILPLA